MLTPRLSVWVLNRTDYKGELLQEFTSGLRLVYENIGNTPTFQSAIGESIIDYNLSRLTDGHAISD